MIVVGVDVGARMTRAVAVSDEEEVLGRAEVRTGVMLARAAGEAFEACLEAAGASPGDVAYVAATGIGRYQVPFRHVQITEITCHARGAVAEFPGTRTVIDVGAQNARAVRIAPSGRVLAFRVNDKCASGAGRFLERTAKALELPLERVGPVALQATHPCEISSICAVLAESEVINLVSQEAPVPDIVMGATEAIVDRVLSLARRVKPEPEVTLTGGLVLNPAVPPLMGRKLGMPLNVSPDGAFTGARGAALLGLFRARRVAA